MLAVLAGFPSGLQGSKKAYNDTDEGRAQNRRIEFKLSRRGKQ